MATTETKCVRCEGEGWITPEQECRRCEGSGATYTYDDPRYLKFVEDMQEQGFRVRHYHGRWYYSGPAVQTSRNDCIDLQDIMRATDVRLRTDSMGLETIVYPA
jgi:hypothetical protein